MRKPWKIDGSQPFKQPASHPLDCTPCGKYGGNPRRNLIEPGGRVKEGVDSQEVAPKFVLQVMIMKEVHANHQGREKGDRPTDALTPYFERCEEEKEKHRGQIVGEEIVAVRRD